jgi:hypothetical protein
VCVLTSFFIESKHISCTFAALDSAAVRSAIPGHVENLGHSGINVGRSVAMKEDSLAPEEKHETKVIETIKVSVPGQEENAGQSRVNFGKTTVMGEVPHAPQNTPVSHAPGVNGTRGTDPSKTSIQGQEERSGQRRVNLERPMSLEEDPYAPKDRPEDFTSSNYQTEVTDPTGTGKTISYPAIVAITDFLRIVVYINFLRFKLYLT